MSFTVKDKVYSVRCQGWLERSQCTSGGALGDRPALGTRWSALNCIGGGVLGVVQATPSSNQA